MSEGSGQLHYHATASGIVDGAVIDAVPFDRDTDSQVVPVRGVENSFVPPIRITTFHDAKHVMGVQGCNPAHDAPTQAKSERYRPEVTRIGCLQQLIEIPAGRSNKLLTDFGRYPGGDRQGRFARLTSHVGVRAAPRVSDNFPGIARGVWRVDDDGAEGSAPKGFFVLESPATVVGKRVGGEEVRIIRRRFVAEQQDNLALHVRVLIVIPLVFGGRDPMADEHHFGVDSLVGLLPAIDDHEVVQKLHRDGLALPHPREFCLRE